MKKIILLFLFLSTLNCNAQWNVFSENRNIIELKDFLFLLKEKQLKEGYHFFGAMWTPEENVSNGGISINSFKKISRIKKIPQSDKLNFYDLGIDSKNHFKLTNKTFIYLNNFTKENRGYTLLLNDGEEWYYYNQRQKLIGYQIPKELFLSQFRSLKGEYFNTQKSVLKKMVIALPKNTSNDFVIGDLKLCEEKIIKTPARALVFSELTKKNENDQDSYTLKEIGDSYPYKELTLFRDILSTNYFFELKDSLQESEVKKETINLILKLIKKYSFLDERNISKSLFFKKLDSLKEANIKYEEKLNGIKKIIDKISDGHFHIVSGNNRQKRGPVIVKEIKGKPIVAGVFNENLKKEIPIGVEVKKIDNLPVEEYIEKLKIRQYGKEQRRRSRIIDRLLYKKKKDSTRLTFLNNGKKTSITYSYNKRNKIPKNFKPVHGKYKQYNSWGYFRLNSWRNGDWIRFYNHQVSLKNNEGIIFDLRGNPGGLEIEALRIASCFIEKTTTASHTSFTFNKGSKIYASNIIKPNKFLNLRNKKVVILVNEKTACASELFITLLKQNSENVFVIGDQPTSGTFANVYNFHLPFGLVFKNNVISKTYPTGGKEYQIEFQGIEPDVYVPIYSYKDLFAYDDAVLSKALEIIELL